MQNLDDVGLYSARLYICDFYFYSSFRMVEDRYATTAGMFAAAALITGIFSGILMSFLWPWVISHVGN